MRAVGQQLEWPGHQRADLERLMGEIVPLEHPLYLLQAAGPKLGAERLSDRITQAALERTVLYNERFQVARVRHQMVARRLRRRRVAVLTVSRWQRVFLARLVPRMAPR